MNNVSITTECVADIPSELKTQYDIGIIYYDIETEKGLFKDTDEVSAINIMEYMAGGEKKAQSVIPSANDYKNFFAKTLKENDEIVHICISSGISNALENAKLAKAKLGVNARKVHIIDSKNLSSGQGLLALEAAKMRNEGLSAEEIEENINNMIPRVSTSFLTYNADYLYYNGKVSKRMMQLCNYFRVHPVLYMKDGVLTLKKIYFGNYESSALKYINNVLHNSQNIMDERGFITYAGCGHELREKIKNHVRKKIHFRNLIEQAASATVSCNCGPSTFGILFIMEK